MNPDQFEEVRKAADMLAKQKEMYAGAFRPLNAQLAETLKRYKEYQTSYHISPEILERLRTLSTFSVQLPKLRLDNPLLELSRTLDKRLESVGHTSRSLAKMLEGFHQANSLVSANIVQAIAASAFNTDELRRISSTIGKAFSSDEFARALASRLEHLEPSLKALRGSYFGDLAARAREIIETGNVDDLAEFEELVTERVNDKRQSGGTKIALAAVIVGVLSLVVGIKALLIAYDTYQLQLQQGEEAKVEQQFQNEALEKIVEATQTVADAVRKNTTPAREYKVDRTAELKTSPSFGSRTIGILDTGMSVHLIPPDDVTQKYHKWLRVEALDPLTGLPEYGWISKKYLRPSGN